MLFLSGYNIQAIEDYLSANSMNARHVPVKDRKTVTDHEKRAAERKLTGLDTTETTKTSTTEEPEQKTAECKQGTVEAKDVPDKTTVDTVAWSLGTEGGTSQKDADIKEEDKSSQNGNKTKVEGEAKQKTVREASKLVWD